MQNSPLVLSQVINREDLPNLFLPKEGQVDSPILTIVESIEIESRKLVWDVSKQDDLDGIRSLAHNIAKARVAIDNAGKSKKESFSNEINIIDANRNEAKSRLKELQDEIRKPLTEKEQQDKERKADIESRLEWLSSAGNATMSSDEILSIINTVSQPIDDSWDEYKDDAIAARENTLVRLNNTFVQVKKSEDEKAELLLLRQKMAEAEKREAERQAADKARAEAEAKAERQAEQQRQEHQRQLDHQAMLAAQELQKEQQRIKDLEAAEEKARIEAKRKEDEAKAEHQRQLDEIETKAKAEKERQEQERRAQEAISKQLELKKAAEAKKRQEDQELKDQISHNVFIQLTEGGIPKNHAKKVIALILDDKVSHIGELVSLV